MGYPNRRQAIIQRINHYGSLVIYLVALLPFLSLAGIRELFGEDGYSVYQSIGFFLLVTMVIVNATHLRLDAFFGLYSCFQLYIFVITTIHRGFSIGILVVSCASILLVLLMQKDAAVIIRAFAIITVATIVLNLGYIIFLGTDARTQYFIGGKNHFSIFLIPACFALVANSLVRKGRISRSVVALALVCVWMILWGGSAAGIVTVMAMAVMLLWIRKQKLSIPAVIAVIVIVNVIMVFFSEILTKTSLWIRILRWLGKEETLTSRVMIWDSTIDIIKENWLFGVGRGIEIKYKSNWGYVRTISEAHNFLLEILLEGGVIALLLYSALFWTAVKKMNMSSKLHRIILVAVFVMMINGLVESINNKLFINAFIGLAYCCSRGVIYEKNFLPEQKNDSLEG